MVVSPSLASSSARAEAASGSVSVHEPHWTGLSGMGVVERNCSKSLRSTHLVYTSAAMRVKVVSDGLAALGGVGQMLGERRRRDICELIEKSGYVESRQLAAESRRERLHGSSRPRSPRRRRADPAHPRRRHAASPTGTRRRALRGQKDEQRLAEKRAIAAYAASLVSDGDSLVLDSGSTTYALAQVIRGATGLTVATNDLRIAHYLAEGGGVRLLVTGGQLIDSVFTLVGPSALTNLAGLQVDWAFLGADAVDPEAGVTNVNTVEVPIKQAMLAAAARNVLLADSSKFGRRASRPSSVSMLSTT